MARNNDKASTNGSDRARVADVLKSSLERGLVEENDAVLIAGHGSHIVTQVIDPDQERDSQMSVSWDDAKYQAFTERLTQLRDNANVM